MAAFDARIAQIVVRIVYDGAGPAGKTANLISLQRLFTRGRRGEIVTQEATQGRTLFYEHMALSAPPLSSSPAYDQQTPLDSQKGQPLLIC